MRRFLFWSLCFCLLFPVGLSSCDGSDSAAVIFGGTTGELTWTLTEDGVLTITGEGPMPDYRDGGTSETPPWYPHVNRISSLTIGEGVTRIGDYAFMLCSFVTEVVIPESVTSMGDWAFWHCQSLFFIGNSNFWERLSTENYRWWLLFLFFFLLLWRFLPIKESNDRRYVCLHADWDDRWMRLLWGFRTAIIQDRHRNTTDLWKLCF